MPIGAIKLGRDARGNPRGALHQQLVDARETSLREFAEVAKRQGWSSGEVDDRSLRVVSVEDLYRRFQYSSLDVIGQPSAAWVQHGFSVGIGATVDVGSLILPGWGVLEVDVGGAVERTDAILIVVTRQSSSMSDGRNSFRLLQPICLMALGGACWKKSVRIGLTAGVKAGFSVDANKGFDHNIKSLKQIKQEEAEDEEKKKKMSFMEKVGDAALEQIGLELEASATATIGGSYEGDVVALRDASPTWHLTPAATSLVRGFDGLIGKGDKAGIKARISAFFTDQGQRHLRAMLHEQPWYQRAAKLVTTKGRIPFENLEQSLDEATQYLGDVTAYKANASSQRVMAQVVAAATKLKELAAKKATDKTAYTTEKATLKAELDALFEDALLTKFKPARHFFGGNPTLEEYATAIEIVTPIAKLVTDPRAFEECKDEIAYHRQTIKTFKAYIKDGAGRTTPPAPSDDIRTNLCKLDLWGHSPAVRAGLEVKVEASALAGILGAEAAAGVSAKKNWKFTNYRYQHYSELVPAPVSLEPPKIVVTTQDTVLRYSQTVLTAEAGVTAMDISLASTEKTKVYNQMTYESATLCWSPGLGIATPLPGTGYHIGQSVTVDGLLEAWLEDEAGKPAALENLAKCIYVTGDELRMLLGNSWLVKQLEVDARGRRAEADKKKHFTIQVESDETSVILLEAAYWSRPTRIPILDTNPNAPEPHENMHTMMLTAMARDHRRRGLESIRIRYRRADAKDASKGFTLGIPIKPVKIGIELKVAQRAGSSGIVDLDIRWFNDKAPLNARGGAGLDDETVPPVAIFHQ